VHDESIIKETSQKLDILNNKDFKIDENNKIENIKVNPIIKNDNSDYV